MIYFIFFFTNCLCFLVFGLCLAGTIYFYIENTIIGQDILQDISIIIIFPIIFSCLHVFTCIGCLVKNRFMLCGHMVVLGVLFGSSLGGVIFFHHQYGTAGVFLVLEQVLTTTLDYKQELNILILIFILFYGIPLVIIINIVMACIMFFQLSYTDSNKTQTIQSGGNYDNIHQNPQNENPPTNPHYQQNLTERIETAIPMLNQNEGHHQQVHSSLQNEGYHQQVHSSLQNEGYHQQVHSSLQNEGYHQQVHTSLSLSHQEPPSYNEAVIMDIQSTPEETSFQRQIHPIQPPLPQEAPPPYQLWMLKIF